MTGTGQPAFTPTIQEPVRRDRKGNWVFVSRTYGYPTSDATPFADRWRASSQEAARERFPLLADGYADFIDFRLLPAITNAREVEAREMAVLAKERAAAMKANDALHERIRGIEEAHRLKAAFLVAQLVRATSELDGARLAASIAVGAADALFDPESETLGLSMPEAPTLEHVAGSENIPFSKYDAEMAMPVLAEAPIATLLGSLVGISAFNAFGIVHPLRLSRDPLGIVFAAVAIGAVAVFALGRAIKGSAALAAQDSELGRGKSFWKAVASALALTGLAVHCATDSVGLMRSSSLRAQNGLQAPIPVGLVLVVASTFSIGYVAYSFVSGCRTGRAAANGPRLTFLRDEALAKRRREWPTDERRAALKAVGEWRARQAQVAEIEKRIAAAQEALAREVKGLDERRVTVPETFSAAGSDRIDVASEAARGTQREADSLERALLALMGERPFGWLGWWRWWRTRRASR